MVGMPLPRVRRRPRVQLTVAAPTQPANPFDAQALVLSLPGAGSGLLAGVAAALSGWLLVAGSCLVVWFTVMTMPLPVLLRFSSQWWLSGLGAGAQVADRTITITPLGLSLILVWIVRVVAAAALRRVLTRDDEAASPAAVWRVAIAVMVGFAAFAGLVALATGSGGRVAWAIGGGAVVAGLGSLWAVLRITEAAGRWPVPALLRGSHRLVAAGLLALFALGAIGLTAALIVGSHRIALIEQAVGFDLVGQVAWCIATLAYLPNLLIWAASFALGAGFTVGVGTVVTPWFTHVGLLPAIPVLGAVPLSGSGNGWAYLWLTGGIITGALIGWAVPRAGRSLSGVLIAAALAALLAALAFFALAAVARGDLGIDQLAGFGPRLAPLAWMLPLPLLLAACATSGLLWWRRPQLATVDTATIVIDDDDTVLLPS